MWTSNELDHLIFWGRYFQFNTYTLKVCTELMWDLEGYLRSFPVSCEVPSTQLNPYLQYSDLKVKAAERYSFLISFPI